MTEAAVSATPDHEGHDDLVPPRMTWAEQAFHPLMLRAAGRRAVASLYELPWGIYTVAELARALAAAGVSASFGEKIVGYLVHRGVCDRVVVCLATQLGPWRGLKEIERKAVVVHPERLTVAWPDFEPMAFEPVILLIQPVVRAEPALRQDV